MASFIQLNQVSYMQRGVQISPGLYCHTLISV